jgi:hypothetical protein
MLRIDSNIELAMCSLIAHRGRNAQRVSLAGRDVSFPGKDFD